MLRKVMGVDLYNQNMTGTVSKTLNSIATDSDHIPVVIIERDPIMKVYTIDAMTSNSMKSSNPYSGIHETNVAKCLDTACLNPSCNQGGHMVCIALEGNGARPSHLGKGFSEDGTMYTLNTIEQHSVCYSVDGDD